ncbi:MAG: Hsp70 family protein, partial [Ignavibacteriaceae bacterium]
EHAAEDKKKKENIETKNQAESLVFQTKKQIDEMKDKIPADSKSKLEAEIKKVEDAITSNNTDQMKSATESLSKEWNEIASNLYSQTGGQQQQEGQQKAGPQQEAQQGKGDGKEEAQDASYEVVDDENKDKDKK